jgi:cellulose synthase/poly-beta-1,6-N-acetylglucosamine synthase-like glycosyltransferase
MNGIEGATQSPRIGDYLVESRLITRSQLDAALRRQERSKVRLGTILSTLGIVGRYQLYKALAHIWRLPFVDLLQEKPDPAIVRLLPPGMMIEAGFIPLSRQGTQATVAISERLSPEMEDTLLRSLGVASLQYAVTTPWDIHISLSDVFRTHLVDDAIYGLTRKDPMQSAHTVLTAGQFWFLAVFLTALLAGLCWSTRATLIILNLTLSVIFFGGIFFKFAASIASLKVLDRDGSVSPTAGSERESDLPLYTILVPVYREANVIGLLMKNLAALDYPAETLQILVLLEEEDQETIEAAKRSTPPVNVQLVIVPNQIPKTKPKACNYGLNFAKGEFLVIYDAEDRPDPDQLRKAVAAFRNGSPDLVCVQAALNYFNVHENFLTRMFTLEYSYWFDYLQPGLESLGFPIPLGGTSNHFKTDHLKKLGAWDPFNVTEDADLGVRASAYGFRVGTIDSTTLEEANNRYGNWFRQRSRWIKGYMQTTLVNLRSPVGLVRRIGWWRTMGFLLLVGGNPLGALASPILWMIYFVWLFTRTHGFDVIFPPAVLYIGLFNLLVGNGLIIYLTMLSVFRRKHYELLPWALLSPLYWMFHSVASYKALYQLFTRPFYWEKTVHGLTKHRQAGGQSPVPVESGQRPDRARHAVPAMRVSNRA